MFASMIKAVSSAFKSMGWTEKVDIYRPKNYRQVELKFTTRHDPK